MTNRYNTSGRNYGYGKQTMFAVKNALKDKYGGGKFATRAAHEARFKHFANYINAEGINDLRKVDENTFTRYSKTITNSVNAGDMKVTYAQNLLSTVNVVMEQMRGDTNLSVSPSATVGQRTHIRSEAPKSVDRAMVQSAVEKMTCPRAQASVPLAREFGLRFKETALLNLNRAIKEASTLGKINIVDGTKGGRTADRWVNLSKRQIGMLKQTKHAAGKFKNLVGKTGNFKQWQNQFAAEYRNSGARKILGKFHDLRAAFACERYQELTGKPAPVITGQRTASYEADLKAREQLATFLGHNRISVVNSYIGTSSV
ncbi:integrase domain-containing protein [Psychrosphaera sp. F3M07]|uniref:integrase domain-containing protein n=1 Tax=Psychrosphaera sp. F3M07 TaxID=2841560 RepID=UPI001C096A75|nr:integrase domain-containing protein [Psychrosphaera sp. F3M07]MBU2919064.1 integrase domain-containing protein [Psychrosphaera sp. F3M07]